LIEESELADLVACLAKMTNTVVDCRAVYIVSTDDVEFSGVLEMLADGLIRKRTPKKVEDKVRKKKKRVVEPTGKKLGLHSYIIDETGETISAQLLHKRIGNHEMARGTMLTNGRGEKFQVALVSDGEPFRVVKIEAMDDIVAEGEQA
jgi:hypothetical protein